MDTQDRQDRGKAAPVNIILSAENWETRQLEGEELVAVEIRPRVSVKMRKSEAIAKGLYRESTAEDAKKARKSRGPGKNKMRVPAEDKGG